MSVLICTGVPISEGLKCVTNQTQNQNYKTVIEGVGNQIQAGVRILDMIDIVRRITPNVYYEDLWDDADERLRQGSQLSDALFASPLIPRSVAQMIYTGEKPGRLSQVMGCVADFTEFDFDEQVKNTTQFIEPALIATMGRIVGFVAIVLLLPIFSAGQVVSGS